MSRATRQIYVISDLHIGGDYDDDQAERPARGFRICTHVAELASFVQALVNKPVGGPAIELVINGDFLDFLAEEHAGEPMWRPFLYSATEAVSTFDGMFDRDRVLFEALQDLLAAGHRLVIILGNHDVELVLPAVRQRLRAVIDPAKTGDFEFIFDGEPYIVGDEAIIEHGNRYDPFNVIDHGALRALRSSQARRQQDDLPEKQQFTPPPGSFIVSEIMNEIKKDYGFVDLLKPEAGAAIPLLLALEPAYWNRIAAFAKLTLRAAKSRKRQPALPLRAGEISATDDTKSDFGSDLAAQPRKRREPHAPIGNNLATARKGSLAGPIGESLVARTPGEREPTDSEALGSVLRVALGDASAEFMSLLGLGAEKSTGKEIAAKQALKLAVGLARLLTRKRDSVMAKRLPALQAALRALQGSAAFDRSVETEPYIGAAVDLVTNGFKVVVFGHTHLAKHVDLSAEAAARGIQVADRSAYLNSGTWADLIRVPDEIIHGTREQASEKLEEFVECIRGNDLSPWITFRPTYVRLDIDEAGKVLNAGVYEFEASPAGGRVEGWRGHTGA